MFKHSLESSFCAVSVYKIAASDSSYYWSYQSESERCLSMYWTYNGSLYTSYCE